MAGDLRFGILGPLAVTRAGQAVPVGPAKPRALLATLLLRANRAVAVADIAERVWGQAPPVNARRGIQLYVVRLRQALGGARDMIVTEPDGYRIEVAPDQLDYLRFSRLIHEADAASAIGDLSTESRLLSEALALWRGPVIADVDCEALHLRDVPAIAERGLSIEERWADVELRRGRHTELVPRLRELTAAHPFRERFWAQLMLALFRGGRRAEALETYRTAAEVLATELGLDPGADLQRLHRSILNGSPPLPAPAHRCDLPRDVSHFTGRTEEILRVLRAPTGSTGVIVAIDGMAGVGKTTLAVHAARRLIDRYPDAQLYVDLHAHTPGQRALTPATALHKLLRAVNVPGEQIPDDLEERAALWRARLADRRALVVLDNAVDSSQVQPMLPGSPSSLVLVTSRRRLLGLDGTHLISLDVMPPPDAASLLTHVVGDTRAAMEPAAVAELVELCGFLPLAVSIAAARLRHRPTWTVTQLAARLRQHRRLTELQADGRDVNAVFSLSYHHLAADQQLLFRRLGLHPGPDIDTHAAAALANLPAHQAEPLLEALLDAHLLQQHAASRYRFHALMREFAIDLAHQQDDAATMTAAKRRLLDWYLHSTAAAARRLNPNRSLDPVPEPPDGIHPPIFTSDQQALDWMDAQYDCLVAAYRLAADDRMTRHAWLLPWIMSHYRHHVRGQSAETTETFETALALCRDTADHEGQAYILCSLGVQYALRANHPKAITLYHQAITISREIGIRSTKANALINLAISHGKLGRHDDAVHYAEKALAIAETMGSRAHEGAASRALGKAHQASNRYPETFAYLRRALTIGEELNYPALVTTTLLDIGRAHRELGDHHDAITAYERALHISRDYGSRSDEGAVLSELGDLHHTCDNPTRARDYWQQALTLLTTVGHPSVEQLRTKLAAVHRRGAISRR